MDRDKCEINRKRKRLSDDSDYVCNVCSIPFHSTLQTLRDGQLSSSPTKAVGCVDCSPLFAAALLVKEDKHETVKGEEKAKKLSLKKEGLRSRELCPEGAFVLFLDR